MLFEQLILILSVGCGATGMHLIGDHVRCHVVVLRLGGRGDGAVGELFADGHQIVLDISLYKGAAR